MDQLTDAERAYLARHEVPLEDVIDVFGMKPAEYRPIMKVLGARVGYNAGRCQYGHTMRNRHGRCVQCNPQDFEFARRHHARGQVYVAWSYAHGLAKVGMAEYVELRVDELNRRNYGSITDWSLQHSVACMYAGIVEHEAQRRLHRFHEPRSYLWGRHVTLCYEVYGCSLETAIAAVDDAARHADVDV